MDTFVDNIDIMMSHDGVYQFHDAERGNFLEDLTLEHVPDLIENLSCVIRGLLWYEIHLLEEEVHLEIVKYQW